ncbi:MAG TPA: exo-beta-N-acetylmuramidase NamZ domain-containing protein [Bryobacteraceae bacterium]|nr:exo-beta-N-acetylmuramidase NamZ domain-containing protein [Bryobacteraceae bacterium]
MRLLLAMACAAACAFAQTFSSSAALDASTEQAIRDGLIPGAVLVVGHDGKIVHRKAYGARALVPAREAATLDTIYDIASLTKVVATTPAIMKLHEQGKIRLDDPVTAYLPEFQGGRSPITIRQLMTHFSGLRPDLDIDPAWSGYDTGIRKALVDKPAGPPEERFVYSDINFELLGEIVRRVSGQPLDRFAREQVFEPLGMIDTTFKPASSARIAPTELDAATGKPWRGVVHDPTARYMGGVAGHAGVFSTADDLARYAGMMLGGRLFAPATVALFTSNAAPSDQPILRGLGWDIDSPYSSNRGDLFPRGASYGHTGFTGPSIWIDPASRSFVVIMTNRVHPKGGRSINEWRRSVATIAAEGLGLGPKNHRVMTGLDVLAQSKFAPLEGRQVGLITNQTGIDRQGRRNLDLMLAAGIRVTALFSPEHGITGRVDQPNVADSRDDATGLPVFSLYFNSRFRLTPEMLRGVDTLVFDIQDVGARFFTYNCTMLFMLEAAAQAKKPFYVLDRPNPVTGSHVEGPLLDPGSQAITGCYSLPVRHGLTPGELATMGNAERKLNADLHVIKMQNWERGDWFDSTGLPWIDPSPNMRSLNAATLYPGLALIESSKNYSVGRGTDAPFEQIGAEWIRGVELAEFLNSRYIPGVRVYPTHLTAKTEGVRFVITDRDQLDSVRLGLEVASALQKLYPGKIDFELSKQLIGNRKTIDALKAGDDPRVIEQGLLPDLAAFMNRRRPFLLY